MTLQTALTPSSVLGNQVISEIDEQGNKLSSYVYMGASLLARQIKGIAPYSNDYVSFEHRDVSNASLRATAGNGNILSDEEYDPVGADADLGPSLNEAPPVDEAGGSLLDYPSGGSPAHMRVDYVVAGIPVSRDTFMSFVEMAFPEGLGFAMLSQATRPVGYRWVQRGTLTITDTRGPQNPATDFVVGNTVTVPLGYFQPVYGDFSWGFLVIAEQLNHHEGVINQQVEMPWAQAVGIADAALNKRKIPLSSGQLDIIRNIIAGLLTDKCVKFINQIVSGRTGKPYDAKTELLTDFDKAKNSTGGFYWRIGGGSAGGYVKDGTASISLGYDTEYFTNPKDPGAFNAAITALHELLHTIAGNDQQLSNQVRDLGITVYNWPGNVAEFPTDKDNGKLAYSEYWGQALKNACTPRGY